MNELHWEEDVIIIVKHMPWSVFYIQGCDSISIECYSIIFENI